MIVTINGTEVDLDEEGATLGDIFAKADDLVEKTGSVILGLTLDGNPVNPESLPELKDKSSAEFESLAIESVSASELRSQAYGTLLEFLRVVRQWAAGSEASNPLQETWASYINTYAGLLSSDELSFLEFFGKDIESLPKNSATTEREALIRHTERLEPIFRERFDELADPAAAMRTAARLYASERENLKDIPVRLQTGKDAEAMRSILFFVEIFNKANRILPELPRHGVETGRVRIKGQPLPEFYESFNTVLRELTEAFETKDAVLIGDLAEYEIVPRMNDFFEAITGALDT